MEPLDEKKGAEEEAQDAPADIQAEAAETAPVQARGEPAAAAQPQKADRADDPLPVDLMDIFESEEMADPSVVIPGLEQMTMSEVASETEAVLEEMRSRFLS